MLKLEPREADRVLVPDLSIIRAHASRLEELGGALHGGLCAGRRGSLRQVIAEIDEIVLGKERGETRDGVLILSAAREHLRNARRLAVS